MLSSVQDDKFEPVAILGLGYVGWPLAIAAAASGLHVIGIDTSDERLDLLDSEVRQSQDISQLHLELTTDHSQLSNTRVILVCVPTPLGHNGVPDLTHLQQAAASIRANLKEGQIVVLESTSFPGTTDEYLKDALEESGLKAGLHFHLGFSPERIDPGPHGASVREIPKLVSGTTETALRLIAKFYSKFIDHVVPVSSTRVAEMAKLLENTYRHVNIALANEMAILCHDLDVDIWEVIEAASTKPFGFQPFYPGPGWGGHCIPVDPAYLSWKVREMGDTARFVELAREINEAMPKYVIERVKETLLRSGASIQNANVLVLGVAYKADVADVRESPALRLISLLRKEVAGVDFDDPFVSEIEVDGHKMHACGLDDLETRDVVIVHTDHSAYDWTDIARRARLVFDTRNALDGIEGPVERL